MKRIIVCCFLSLMAMVMFAQYGNNSPTLKFNSPYTSSNNRSVILPADRIPSDFLGCTLGVTSEIDALKNLSRLGIQFTNHSGGASDVLTIYGNIECEGAKFRSVSLWFYNSVFWKIVFESMLTDSNTLRNIINKKYSKFPKSSEQYGYVRYRGYSADLVHNEHNLQYTIRGGSATRLED